MDLLDFFNASGATEVAQKPKAVRNWNHGWCRTVQLAVVPNIGFQARSMEKHIAELSARFKQMLHMRTVDVGDWGAPNVLSWGA